MKTFLEGVSSLYHRYEEAFLIKHEYNAIKVQHTLMCIQEMFTVFSSHDLQYFLFLGNQQAQWFLQFQPWAEKAVVFNKFLPVFTSFTHTALEQRV